MKRLGTGIILLFAIFTLHVAAVNLPDDFELIAASIRIGDSHTLAERFDRTVDIKTEDKSVTYSKNQGELVLREFFQRNAPRNFTIIHRGSSARGAKYIIGTLETVQGNFRTFVYVKEQNNKRLIEEMSFEKQ